MCIEMLHISETHLYLNDSCMYRHTVSVHVAAGVMFGAHVSIVFWTSAANSARWHIAT